MEELDSEVPLPKGGLTVGIVYNLKKGTATSAAPDAEAEYDSIDTVNAIKSALESNGNSVVLLEADENLPEKLQKTQIDIAFNIAEGIRGRGREAQIPALLNFFGIPFTGSDETALSVALDKAMTKRLAATYKIRTPKYRIAKNSSDTSGMTFPVIVKPNAEGSSKGISDISIAKNKNELSSLLTKNAELYGSPMLVEEYIHGREFTVGIIGNDDDTTVFAPMEIVYKKTTQENFCVYSYNVKQNYKEFIEYHCPACLAPNEEIEMKSAAIKVYNMLGCVDFSRVDFRMSDDGKIYFIEINPLPGLAPGYSDYPMLAEFCGTSYGKLVNSVLDAARKRLGK